MEYDIVLQSIKNNFHLIQLKIFTNLVFKLNFFFLFQNSCTGTYLNYKKINKEVALQNGDLIGFTDKTKTWDFVYKFCLLPNPNKKPK